MKNKLLYSIVFIFLFTTIHVYAQSNNLWLRTTFSVKDSLGITYDTELQYRLQNNNENLFPNKNILNSARIWMHYSPNEKLKISFSPIAIFDHIQYKNEDQPYEKYHLTEYRNSLATEYKLVEKEIVDIYARTAIEGRFFIGNNPKFRWRNRVGMDIKFNSKTSIKTNFEIFHVADNKTLFSLDQTRFSNSLKHKFSSNISLELGYIYLVKPTKNNFSINENNALVNISYQL